jgi:hypothetical protein
MIRAIAVALVLPSVARADPTPLPLPEASRSLDFGIVFSGYPQAVAPSDSGAALWVFRGDPGATVTLKFTALPEVLLRDGQALSVTFGPNSAAWNTTDDPATATAFDPVTGTTATIGPDTNQVYVWLGATAVPARGGRPGVYAARYTLDVAYVEP